MCRFAATAYSERNGFHGTRDQRLGPVAIEKAFLIRGAFVVGCGGAERFSRGQILIEKNELLAAAPLEPLVVRLRVVEKTLQDHEKKGAELAPFSIGARVGFALDQISEKRLGQILRIVRRVASSPNERIKRRPIVAA